jgi:hypothetical protein
MKLIGHTLNLIDWDSVIAKCKNGTPLLYTEQAVPNNEHFQQLDAIWQKAGYKYGDTTIEWINYFPDQFGKEVETIFAGIVNATPWMVWISCIRPGKMAPWHFDAHTNLAELNKLGKGIRYTCYIQEPHDGHISIVGNEAVYKPAKGSIYEWPNHDAWHCGMNGGLENKYMFNFWGYQ